MINKHAFDRRTVDDFLKSIHPIHKKNKLQGITFEHKIIDSPAKTILDMLELSLSKTCSPSSMSRISTFRENPQIKSRMSNRAASPVPRKYELFKVSGSPLNLTRRYITPLPTRSKGKRVVTKVPFVKWIN